MTGDAAAGDVAAGPIVQSLAIGMRAVWLATALLALVWLASGIRQVPPDRSAVVYRFGRIMRVAPPGLLLAWPSPVETVELIPGAERQLSLHVSPVPRAAGLDDAVDRADHTRPEGNAGSYLTGDGGVVLLDAALAFRINDPVAFVLAQMHVPAALDRLFRDAAVTVAARHRLDDFLVTEAGSAARPDAASARQAVRDELAAVMNRRLAALALAGGGLGIEIMRIDLTATLPPPAKRAYDAVLSATQRADQALARARTDAERIRQQAARERDRLLATAHAQAAERVGAARTDTARIAALAAQEDPAHPADLLARVWRERIAQVLHQVGQVTAVDERGGMRLILSGRAPAGGSMGAGSVGGRE